VSGTDHEAPHLVDAILLKADMESKLGLVFTLFTGHEGP
jgi:hypothetical protein